MNQFWALAKTPGFTGSVVPGLSLERLERRRARVAGASCRREDGMEVEAVVEGSRWAPTHNGDWEEDDSEGEDAEQEMVSTILYQMSVLSVDREDGRGSDSLN